MVKVGKYFSPMEQMGYPWFADRDRESFVGELQLDGVDGVSP